MSYETINRWTCARCGDQAETMFRFDPGTRSGTQPHPDYWDEVILPKLDRHPWGTRKGGDICPLCIEKLQAAWDDKS